MKLPSDQAFSDSSISYKMAFDSSHKCPCGCGFPSILASISVDLHKEIGVVGCAMLYAEMMRAVTRGIVEASNNMDADGKAMFLKILDAESKKVKK